MAFTTRLFFLPVLYASFLNVKISLFKPQKAPRQLNSFTFHILFRPSRFLDECTAIKFFSNALSSHTCSRLWTEDDKEVYHPRCEVKSCLLAAVDNRDTVPVTIASPGHPSLEYNVRKSEEKDSGVCWSKEQARFQRHYQKNLTKLL